MQTHTACDVDIADLLLLLQQLSNLLRTLLAPLFTWGVLPAGRTLLHHYNNGPQQKQNRKQRWMRALPVLEASSSLATNPGCKVLNPSPPVAQPHPRPYSCRSAFINWQV